MDGVTAEARNSEPSEFAPQRFVSCQTPPLTQLHWSWFVQVSGDGLHWFGSSGRGSANRLCLRLEASLVVVDSFPDGSQVAFPSGANAVEQASDHILAEEL